MLKVLALAVAGGLAAEAQGAQRIADAGLEDAVLDLDHVPGEGALVVESVARHILGAERALVHGDELAADALADVLLAERAVFHEHIHLHAVAEGLMGDEPGDLGGGDDLILARLDAAGVQQLLGAGHGAGQLVLKLRKELRPAEAGHALVAHLGAPLAARHRGDVAFGVDVALAEIAVLGQKQLADMGGLGAQDAVEHVFSERHAARAERRKTLDQGLHIAALRQLPGLLFHEERERLVREHRRLVHGGADGLQSFLLALQLRADLFRRGLGGGGIKFVEGILAVLSLAVHAHHNTALGGHGLAADAAGALGDAHREALGIGRENAHIVVVLPQKCEQLLQAAFDPAEIGGKRCFHACSPFAWCDALFYRPARRTVNRNASCGVEVSRRGQPPARRPGRVRGDCEEGDGVPYTQNREPRGVLHKEAVLRRQSPAQKDMKPA